MTCTATLNGGPLVCVRRDPHDPDIYGGHVFQSSETDDRHAATEGGNA
jgi:hypothetical protein